MERSIWNSERFAKWEEGTHIPEDVMKMVEIVSEQIGVCVEETTIEHRNRGDTSMDFLRDSYYHTAHLLSKMDRQRI